jgi:hypothetical protein
MLLALVIVRWLSGGRPGPSWRGASRDHGSGRPRVIAKVARPEDVLAEVARVRRADGPLRALHRSRGTGRWLEIRRRLTGCPEGTRSSSRRACGRRTGFGLSGVCGRVGGDGGVWAAGAARARGRRRCAGGIARAGADVVPFVGPGRWCSEVRPCLGRPRSLLRGKRARLRRRHGRPRVVPSGRCRSNSAKFACVHERRSAPGWRHHRRGARVAWEAVVPRQLARRSLPGRRAQATVPQLAGVRGAWRLPRCCSTRPRVWGVVVHDMLARHPGAGCLRRGGTRTRLPSADHGRTVGKPDY